MAARYERAKTIIHSTSLFLGCLLFTLSLFFISFDNPETGEHTLYFNAGKKLFLLKYNTDGSSELQVQDSRWNYERVDSSMQLPPPPPHVKGNYITKTNYRYMVMYLNDKTYITVYNGVWGRFFGDYNFTFYGGTHTWEFNASKEKWIDAPAGIQIPLQTRD